MFFKRRVLPLDSTGPTDQTTKGISMSSTPGSVFSSPSSSFSSFAGSRSWALASALALAVALLAAITTSAYAARAAKAPAAKVTITGVTVKTTTTDAKLTVTGRVTLPSNTAAERKRAEVYLTLVGGAGKSAKSEAFSAKLTSKDKFTATHVTTLSGALGLDAVVKIAGRQSGKKVARTISVAGSGKSGTTGSTGTSGGSTTGTVTPGSPGSPSGPSGAGTTLDGTFEIEAGVEHPDGLLSGTYFRMQSVGNVQSPFGDREYTPLSPGTDGGLETFAYQEPPVPAFAGEFQGQPSGNALANEIVQPQNFFEVNFSIATAPTDLQEGLPDPLPQIVDTNGKLSGQITAWDAQWNGSSFNQGAPKANGTLAADAKGSTTLPTGTYDAATGHYVLTWTSLIVGGGFGGFIGEWHLEGTFVPQVAS
jgi:hypothetical protein